MGKTTRLTTDIFIKRAKERFGDKFNYDKTVYKNNRTKVTIICPEHGMFDIRPYDFLKSKFGCPKCADVFNGEAKRKDFAKFLEDARRVHGEKYDYSKADYKNNSTKIIIICPEHGEFRQTPDAHINGKQGCPKCSGRCKKTTQDFIDDARKVHGDKYDYTNTDYVNNKKRVCIICPEHGEFWQKPNNHLAGQGCPECAKIRERPKKYTTESFIDAAIKIHGDKYDYSKTNYERTLKKVSIICHEKDRFGNEHGEFLQLPYVHLAGCGCPKCSNWKLEEEVSNFLIKNGISFVFQKKFSWLGRQSLDFFLPEFKISIECQGSQHFVGWGNKEENFNKVLALDKIKKRLCEEHSIKMLYYTHEKEYNLVQDIYTKENTFSTLEDLLNKIKNT